MDLKCKPIFELPILFEKPISFQLDELMSLKVPLIAVPEPNLVLEKLDKDDEAIVEATFNSNPSLDEPVHKGQHFVLTTSISLTQKWFDLNFGEPKQIFFKSICPIVFWLELSPFLYL